MCDVVALTQYCKLVSFFYILYLLFSYQFFLGGDTQIPLRIALPHYMAGSLFKRRRTMTSSPMLYHYTNLVTMKVNIIITGIFEYVSLCEQVETTGHFIPVSYESITCFCWRHWRSTTQYLSIIFTPKKLSVQWKCRTSGLRGRRSERTRSFCQH